MVIDPKITEKYAKLKGLPGMPNIMQNPWANLPFIKKGWEYRLDALGQLSFLYTPEAPTDSVILTGSAHNWDFYESDEPAWILMVIAVFDNPYGTLHFRLDNWRFSMSPYMLNMTGRDALAGIGHFRAGLLSCNHMTAYGPMYGVVLDPIVPLPQSSDLSLSFSNGSSGAKTSIELLAGAIGRIYIPKDEMDDFLKASRLWQLEQTFAKELR